MASDNNTRTQIIDAAERHFARLGYAGTSLRGIIKEAHVNVGAVAYHFGSKEDLFAAVTERFAAPVVEEQLKLLRAEMQRKDASVAGVLYAFYQPPISFVKKLGAKGETISLFLARCHSEPDPVFSMVDEHYAACRKEFVAAFEDLMPGKRDADYEWRFEFMLSLIVGFLTRHKYVRRRYTTSTTWHVDEVVDMLVSFCLSGMGVSARGRK